MNCFLKGLIWLTVSFAIFHTNIASASVYACESDSSVNTYLNQGQVVTKRVSKSSCPTNIQLKFDYPSSTSKTTICYPSTPENLPNGFVAINSDNYSSCNVGSVKRGYEIKRPSSNEQICGFPGIKIPVGYIVYQKDIITSSCDPSTSPSTTRAIKIKIPSSSPGTKSWDCQSPVHTLPSGFVTTKYSNIASCRTSTTSTGLAREITVPNPSVNTTVCQGSPIPAGFSFFGTGSYSGCGTTGTGYGQGFIIGPVTGNSASVCGTNTSHVPSGYVVTSISSSGSCSGSYKLLELNKISTNSAITACQIGGVNIVPNGFVITKLNTSSSCGGPNYTIQQPSGSSQFICQATPSIPGGWAVQSSGTNTSCSASGSGPSAVIVPTTGNGPFSICANTQIPAGFVINREEHLWSCSNNKGWTVVRPDETPGLKTTVCNSFARENIPSGFVITNNDSLSQCSTTGIGYRISKPILGEDNIICAGSVIPDDFVIKESDYYSQCGAGSNDGSAYNAGAGWTIGTVSGNGPFTLCLGSNIPNGYVVIENDEPVSSCGSGYGMKIILADPSETIAICPGYPIPQNFIVNKHEYNSRCGFDRGLRIKVPSQTGSTFVCDEYTTAIPAGFIKIAGSEKQSSACSFSDISLGASYEISLSSNQVVPIPFINAEADVVSKPTDTSVQCSNNSTSSGLIGSAEKNPNGCN